jgi:predicted transcriptional regulator
LEVKLNKLIKQLEIKRLKLGMTDYKFAQHLKISQQLWGKVKSGEVKRSRKVENAAMEIFRMSPEKPLVAQQGSLISKVVGKIKETILGGLKRT